MKISKSDLQQIIKEEAIRLYQIEKLQRAKKIVDENIRLISEGKKKEMSPEEMEELFGLGGLKNVASAIGQKVGEKIGQAGQKVGEKLGQAKEFVATKYAEGEKKAKIENLTKQKTKIETELQKYNEMLAKVNGELKALTGKPKAAASSAKKAAPKAATARKK